MLMDIVSSATKRSAKLRHCARNISPEVPIRTSTSNSARGSFCFLRTTVPIMHTRMPQRRKNARKRPVVRVCSIMPPNRLIELPGTVFTTAFKTKIKTSSMNGAASVGRSPHFGHLNASLRSMNSAHTPRAISGAIAHHSTPVGARAR